MCSDQSRAVPFIKLCLLNAEEYACAWRVKFVDAEYIDNLFNNTRGAEVLNVNEVAFTKEGKS